MLISYVCYQTIRNCEFHQVDSIPVKIQWIRTSSGVIPCVFLYMRFFVNIVFLFRPHQLMGVKTKLILVTFLLFCLDALYGVVLQVIGISHSKMSVLQYIPVHVLFLINVCLQVYHLTTTFQVVLRGRRLNLFLQMTTPSCFTYVIDILVTHFFSLMCSKENEYGKLLITLFSPLRGRPFNS